jgi:hypothetical protein
MARQQGFAYAIEEASMALGEVAIAKGEYALAEQFLQLDSSAFQQHILFLAYATCGQGRVRPARQHICTILRTEVERITRSTADQSLAPFSWMVLPAVALFFVHRGEVERAIELYALALRDPRVAGSRWYEDVAGQHVAAAAASCPPDIVAAAQARGRARDMVATAKELLAELEAETQDRNGMAEG